MLNDAKKYTGQTDEFEILTFIQHYGGKTNLIDFTDDYHVAAFFACVSSHDKNGRIIFFERQQADSDIRIRKPWGPAHRVIAQKSVFVQPKKGYVEPHTEVSIPKKLKQPVLDHLRTQHGIKAEEIYKDLHGYIQQQDSTYDTASSPVSLTPEQNELCRRMDVLHALNQLQTKPSDMFRGALSVIEDEKNPDRIAQAAHSLREILYPIMSGQVSKARGARKVALARYSSVLQDVGLGRIYGRLTDLAHHGATSTKLDFLSVTRTDFDELVEAFETAMQRVMIPPIESHRSIDQFLSGDPPK